MIDESKFESYWDPTEVTVLYRGEKMSFDKYIELKIQEHDR